MAKPIDPLFAEYSRTAPLLDLRFTLTVIKERGSRGVNYDGPRTAAIVGELITLESQLSAVIERGEKSKAVPAGAAAQKRIAWSAIGRYRSSLSSETLSYIDGRREFCLDPYAPSAELLAVLSDPNAGPRIIEALPGYIARLEATNQNDRALAELRAIDAEPQYAAAYGEAVCQWIARITTPEPDREQRPEPLAGAAAELLFWDAVRAMRARKVPGTDNGNWPDAGIAIAWRPEYATDPIAEPIKAKRRGAARSAA